MALKPVGNRIVVEREASSDRIGSLYIPEQSVEKPQIGRAVAVGKKVEEVAEGDTILFGKFSGNPINYKGVDLLIIFEDDVLLVIEESALIEA